MSRFTVKVQCPGCQVGDASVTVKKPTFLEARIARFTCDTCKAVILVRVKRMPGQDKNQARVETKVDRTSPELEALRADEKEFLGDPPV